MKRVLVVVPNLPYPLVSGGHLRDWQILNLLARAGIRPTLLWFGAGEGGGLRGDDPVSALCAEVIHGGARVERPDAGWGAAARRKLGYVAGRGPGHPFAYQYDAMAAGEVITDTARRLGADTVVLRGFWCRHAAALRATGARVVANYPDASVRLAREMVRSVRNPLRKLGPVCNLVGVRRHERRHLGACDEVWVPTPDEQAEVAAFGAHPRVLSMPNLLDVRAHPNLAGAPGADDTLLLVANFDYAPNHNAARVLLERLLPAIRRRRPAARLLLVGRGLDPRLMALAQRIPGVEAPGFVADLEVWYRRAGVVLLPVREGAGMLFKTIEALAYGKAILGVPEAFRGLAVAAPAPVVVASSWARLAAEAANLMGDTEARRRLGARARRFAETHLSWETGMRCLERSLLLAG